RAALAEKGRRSITITLPDVSPRSIGMLIALYERTVGLYASLVGINAYHQPGVEAGKKAAAAVLAIQKRVLAEVRRERGAFRTADAVARAIGADADTETVFKVLSHMAANPDHGVHREAAAAPGETKFGVPL
ncbi:MAG TPA: glucose-6-phosphate isomerase, partial [Thermoanaerobaculia bacterium]|nr:glucose-6-phosphate isomerase [Thermoanaerobaculia bacterium]